MIRIAEVQNNHIEIWIEYIHAFGLQNVIFPSSTMKRNVTYQYLDGVVRIGKRWTEYYKRYHLWPKNSFSKLSQAAYVIGILMIIISCRTISPNEIYLYVKKKTSLHAHDASTNFGI